MYVQLGNRLILDPADQIALEGRANHALELLGRNGQEIAKRALLPPGPPVYPYHPPAPSAPPPGIPKAKRVKRRAVLTRIARSPVGAPVYPYIPPTPLPMKDPRRIKVGFTQKKKFEALKEKAGRIAKKKFDMTGCP